MTNQELEKYRIQLFRDAAGMEKKPDRTPLVSFFVTWKILDSPYKLTEAMNDYDKMEQVVRHHQEAYGFDTMFDFGTRNPYRVAQAMSSPTYIVDDEAECVSVRDIHICEPKQGAQLAANYEKFLWEVGMAQKFPWWKEDASLQKIQNAYDEMMRYFGYSMKIKNIMKTEYGLPGVTAPNPYAAISMENILGFILGMRGTAMMMRRDKPGLHAMIDAMNELKQGIGLRAYGQHDPVVAYKEEGYQMFEAMITAIKEETIRRMFLVQLRPAQEVKREKVAKETGTSAPDKSQVKRAPVRKEHKVGPNDPCPCGSGKKYKKCCMQKDKLES